MTTRRTFIQSVGGLALAGCAVPSTASSYSRIIGSNDQVRTAVMGVRSRGLALVYSFANAGHAPVQLVDVDTKILEDTQRDLQENGLDVPPVERDIRRTLDDPDIDAIIIATPDHWHAPATIMALQAGKHVYVEKPCSHNPREGELLIEAQEKYGKVVQMGNQQRSAEQSIRMIDLIRSGAIGEVYHAYTWYANSRGSIGNGQPSMAPATLDWDLWQGPAPRRPYHDNYVPYNWHWFWHWGTGESANNGAHELDIARWAMDVQHPERTSVISSRRFHTTDDWEMYDTMNATFHYSDNRSIVWEGHSCNDRQREGRGRGTIIYGTKGSILIDRAGYELYDQEGRLLSEDKAETASTNTNNLSGGGRLTDNHALNFIESIQGKADQQNSRIQEGHVSTMMCHLANIAHRAKADVITDPITGRILNGVGQQYWTRTYHDEWAPKV